MALKDWKKVTENDTFTTYQKKPEEDSDLFITIVRQNYNPEAWGFKKPSDFIVSLGTCSIKRIEKHFKTEPQAKDYAIKLMKEN